MEAADVTEKASAVAPVQAEAAQSSSSGRSLGTAQEPGTPVPRPADMAPSLPRTETSAYAVGHTQPSPVRTLADAVREGPSSQRSPKQPSQQQQQQPADTARHQPGAAPTTPTKAQPGPYSSAVLGLSRSQRSPVQNGPASLSSPSASSGASRGVAAGSPKGPLHPGSSPPAAHRSAAGAAAAAAQGRLRVDTSADSVRTKAVQEASQMAAPPKQPLTPPPAQFALNSEGDFPQLGAVKTRGRASGRSGPAAQSPAGSAAQTPVADSKPTSPSYSATSTPVTATAGKRVWAGNSAGLLQSAGNSPAGWSNRCKSCLWRAVFSSLLGIVSCRSIFACQSALLDDVCLLAGRMQRQRSGRGSTRQMQAAQAGLRDPVPWQATQRALCGPRSQGRQLGEARRQVQRWVAAPV
jgi:hypothetical protein